MSNGRCNRSWCYFESVACIWLDDQLSLDTRRIPSQHITNRTTPYSHMMRAFENAMEKTRYTTRAIDKGSWRERCDGPLWRVETSRAEERCGRSSRWRRRGPDLDWKASRRRASGSTASLHWMVVCVVGFQLPEAMRVRWIVALAHPPSDVVGSLDLWVDVCVCVCAG